ncbi:MAG TPA: L,D-transpeptidase family protein [Gemmatimonadaceae bacterium]|nr:L,D-transpeptidase family protein [Gemmatimonadaceae bacterium]
MRRYRRYGALVVASFLLGACHRGDDAEAAGEVSTWTPPSPDAIDGVPLDAVKSAIQLRITGAAPKGVTADTWRHVRSLYANYAGVPLWLDTQGLSNDRVTELANALASADSDAIRVDTYPIGALASAVSALRASKTPTAEQLADADVLMTSTYAALGEDLLTGQIDPHTVSQSWYIDPREDHVDSALARTLREGPLDRSIQRIRPQDPVYDSLRTQLMLYRELASKGDWPTIPKGPQLKPGESGTRARLAALAERLRAEGYLPADTTHVSAAPTRYSHGLAGAVARFQARHDIGVDSMLGPETVDALNKPLSFRLGQIAANLERYRWLPRSLGDRYILVNVPAFELTAFDQGKPALQMKVIVGQDYQGKATPVFSDSMEFVVFRPYWIVPDSIAKKEVYPKAEADPSFMARNNFEIATIDRRKRVRQRPGDKNSLGLAKLMFPNDFNIYLHDTPQGELFDKDVRAFSHGCIRLQHPDSLAHFVLGWSLDRVHQQMHNGPDNHTVNLSRKIPVYIVYFTTYLQDDQLYFGNDLYNRDDALVRSVAKAAVGDSASAQAVETLRESRS